jgi:hypothetical protein
LHPLYVPKNETSDGGFAETKKVTVSSFSLGEPSKAQQNSHFSFYRGEKLGPAGPGGNILMWRSGLSRPSARFPPTRGRVCISALRHRIPPLSVRFTPRRCVPRKATVLKRRLLIPDCERQRPKPIDRRRSFLPALYRNNGGAHHADTLSTTKLSEIHVEAPSGDTNGRSRMASRITRAQDRFYRKGPSAARCGPTRHSDAAIVLASGTAQVGPR